ncbi:type VII secretion-associated protein [Pseudonocardiaceae bacterium YIM PH 21723]|nr:type VII secretion-associated protein [Pseudonocardiaceae bacterium YIM PH 21723]
MSLQVAVDFGTSSTCVAMAFGPRPPQVVLIDGLPLLPSSVYAAPDGTLYVGAEAERQASVDPARYEAHPKRRVDEPELLLGTSVVPLPTIIRAVLSRATAEAQRQAGGAPVDTLVLTHPADWGAIRTGVLRQAAAGLAQRLVLLPEPVAAAMFYASLQPGSTVAVLDLGGGTVDASVVRRDADGHRVLASRGNPHFGGADIDQLLLQHVGTIAEPVDAAAWQQLVSGGELSDRRRRRVLHQDVRGAKETLSRHAFTDIPLPQPFPDAHLTRSDLEQLIEPRLRDTIGLLTTALADAGNPQLSGLFLVGGSSRIPLVSALAHQVLGILPNTLDQPETVVAQGALRSVAVPAAPVPQAPQLPPPRVDRFEDVQPAQPKKWLPWAIAGAAVLVFAAVAFGIKFGLKPGAVELQTIAHEKYSFEVPKSWAQTGGNPARRQVQVAPPGAAPRTDLIAVEQRALTYDSDADRDRAVREVRSEYDSAGRTFSGFQDRTTFAGRQVLAYHQRLSNAEVDWYVIFSARAQISVGCQFTAEGRDTVERACHTVVHSLVANN